MGIHFSLDQMAVLRACARFFLRAREPASDGAESSHISNMLRFLSSVLQGFQALVTDREQALKKHDPAGADCAAHRTWTAAGPGNNGGDALAAATELHQQGVSVEVCMPARVNAKDACHALDIARAAGVCITDTLPDQDVRKYQWAIDGLFGIGLTRPLDGIYAE